MAVAARSVDEYIAAQNENARSALQRVRNAIRAALPAEAQEVIRCKMPAYEVNGRPVTYSAGWKHHLSIFPPTSCALSMLPAENLAGARRKGHDCFPFRHPPCHSNA